MRILIINVSIDSGSVGRIVRDLYRGIKESGFECKLAYARGGIGNIPKEDTIKICSTFEVYKHLLLTRAFGRTAFYSHLSTVRFLKWVDEYKPDIVHIHGVYGYYINMRDLFTYFQRNKIKVVSTLHSCWDFTGHCCYFDYCKCDQWKKGCYKCTQKSTYPQSSFFENTHWNYIEKQRLYNGLKDCIIVTPSQWLANLTKESFLNNHRIIVIRNGIDTNVFHPKNIENMPYSIDIKKPIILCIANVWEKRKGWTDVVELSNYLLHKDKDIQLVVVGLDKKKEKEIGKKAICISRTNNTEELADIYNIATLVFNPTYEDNYPTVNIEAIACGTPVVTYKTGGSPEAISMFGIGKVIEEKKYDELLELTYQYHKKTRETRDFSETLSYKKMTDEYIKVYKDMCSQL